MKYWLMAVSSPVSTSFSSSMMSSSPVIATRSRSSEPSPRSHRRVGGPLGTMARLRQTVLGEQLLHRRPASAAAISRPTPLCDLLDGVRAALDARAYGAVVHDTTTAHDHAVT